ncbi:FAD/FMN-containing dehydrogenase [Humitalea rosea]|uniref:FAD/FMN-containing dehydrogenase n=1 Tax=Humitalea rosea TaxID=990373 RepID=A0A2W7I9U3_9PROT|nr:FAD-binding oxidoreductase [Humitalea rosea]PZW43676.1 FAD/FMN-containing dehydrogenase [Humitalea rosea]
MPDAPHPRHDIAALVAACPGVAFERDPALVRQKSRDFFWFSPILNRAFRHKTAEILAQPRTEAEVIAIAAACARLRIPLTVRGAGTGTYGQGVPEQGGVLLDMAGLSRVLWARPEAIRAQAGARMLALEDAALSIGHELRMHPSTKRMATIGGFFCGGSGGIGSNLWGGLREPGNMLGARVVTLEETPRVLELRGQDCNLVNRTYGSTGIVVEVEMPLTPTRPWRDAVLAFSSFLAALDCAQALATGPIPAKLVSLLEATAAIGLPPVLGATVAPPGAHLVLAMVPASAEPALTALARAHGGRVTLSADSRARETAPEATPIYEASWGHTTLHARKLDRALTYLQTLNPPGRVVAAAEWSWRHFGGHEMPIHLEFIRYEGAPAANGAHLLRLPAEDAAARARLAQIIAAHEAAGIPVANPHVATVEDGSRHKRVPGDQLGFKALVDPHGLLNPGKMPSYRPTTP